MHPEIVSRKEKEEAASGRWATSLSLLGPATNEQGCMVAKPSTSHSVAAVHSGQTLIGTENHM
jgi:hypothetical protein